MAISKKITSNRNTQRGEGTRSRILDAAEVLFSQRGYDGASMRDLAALADVRMSLVHYHFGAKDQVLAATVDRKIEKLQQCIQDSFDAAASSDGLETIEGCVRAFILPFLVISADKDHPLHNFVVMTSHLMSSYRIPEVKPTLMRLSAVSTIFTESLWKVCPGADEEKMLAGTYLIEAALIFMMQDPGFLDDLSDRHFAAERLDLLADPTLNFFASGLRALINPTSPNY